MRWSMLLAGTVGLTCLLMPLIASASVLVSAMLVAMAFSFMGAGVGIRPQLVSIAQAMTGVAIASMLDVHGLSAAASNGWVFLAVLLTILNAAFVGWLLVRFASLPGTTGAWGSLPGAASIMGSLAAEHGGDGVLVSLMQYLRVVLVVATGPIIAHAIGSGDVAVPAVVKPSMGAAHHESGFALALAIALVGCWLGLRLRLPAGAFLLPLLLGTMAQTALPSGLGVNLYVPKLALDMSFALLGWAIGLQFRRELALALVRSLPQMLGAIVVLMLMCGASAWLIACMSSASFLTAYLATSPGGLDSIVAIALGSNADMNFVAAVQTLRMLSVVAIGPWMAKLIARMGRSSL